MASKIRGIKPDPRGNGKWLAIVSDKGVHPPHKKNDSRKFSYGSQRTAEAAKAHTLEQLRLYDAGMPIPDGVDDLIWWLMSNGTKGRSQPTHHSAKTIKTIDTLISWYLDDRRGEVVETSHKRIEWFLGQFKAFCEENQATSVEHALSELNLRAYRKHVDERCNKSSSKKHFVTYIKHMTELAYEHRVIDELPRNLKSFSAVGADNVQADPFTKEELATLFANASDRMQLYMLLALNGAYTQKDIATMTPDMWNRSEGMIVRNRHKLETRGILVPQMCKLWKRTSDLLEKYAHDTQSGPLLTSEAGTSLIEPYDLIGRQFTRLKKKCKMDTDKSFRNLRTTGANAIRNIYVPEQRGTKTNYELWLYYTSHKAKDVELSYDARDDYTEMFLATDWLETHLFDGGNNDGSAS